MNEVIQYNNTTAITTTPTVLSGLNQPGQEYNMIRVKNEDALDINLWFTNSSTGSGNKYIVKAGDDVLHAFKCSGRVLASVDSGSTTGNLFVQLTKA